MVSEMQKLAGFMLDCAPVLEYLRSGKKKMRPWARSRLELLMREMIDWAEFEGEERVRKRKAKRCSSGS